MARDLTGYTFCACRDCFELTCGAAYCKGCVYAGCPDSQGRPGLPQECQRPDACGADDAQEGQGEFSAFIQGLRCDVCGSEDTVSEFYRNQGDAAPQVGVTACNRCGAC